MKHQGLSTAKRVLIYNRTQWAMWLFQKYTHLVCSCTSAHPAGGADPHCNALCDPGVLWNHVHRRGTRVHGIQKYEKHLLKQESLFDCLAAAGKKTALVAVADSSMAVLFQEREGIDYYILPYDGEVTDKAVALIQEGSYEVVVVYNQEYDDVMHRTFPESEESLQALKNHIAAFDRLCTAAEESWDTEDSLVVWATDHGIHTNENGHGAHGSDLEEDLNVMHFFGAWKGL